MKHSILLCDYQWNIQKVLSCSSDFSLAKGTCLTDYLSDVRSLSEYRHLKENKHTVTTLHFRQTGQDIPSIICYFPDHYLVFLYQVTSGQDFEDFFEKYLHYTGWATETLEIPFDAGYYQIQQMNNQLINTQRALMKKNQQLNNVLQEIRDAHNIISLLEHDELTDLFSVSAFYQKAQLELDQHSDQNYHIIVLNVGQFKLINETFSRTTGDQLLKDLSLFLLGLEHSDSGIFSRASADIFYILMPAQFHFYQILAQKIELFFHTYPLPIHLYARIGVYSTDYELLPVEKMCDRALLALDSLAKQLETKIVFYDQTLHEKLTTEHLILDHVQDAIQNREFLLYLQPKVRISDQKTVGAEALIRWQHAELGWITPDKFIPLLEKNDSIYAVDQYIWEEACRFIYNRKQLGLPTFPISVNAARGDLYQKDLLDVLKNLLDKYQLTPKDLRIEIIERAYVRDSENIYKVLSDLRSAGFIIEMDDFGTGESSLSMIAGMPIDFLKLDRSFLTNEMPDKRHMEIIKFIINLAHTLEIDVIAEGVETQEQADLLLSLGCQYAQGYFYARPQPAEELLEKI